MSWHDTWTLAVVVGAISFGWTVGADLGREVSAALRQRLMANIRDWRK